MKVKTTFLALAITLAAGVLAYGTVVDGKGSHPASRAVGADKSSPRLRAVGGVRGLYPGGHGPVWVRVRNPFDDRVRVRWIRTRVKDAGSSCSRDNLVARRSRGLRQLRGGAWRHVRVPPHQARRVRVRIRMRRGAFDACQGARFPLRYRVKVKAWR
jgi:hypothetical protein